MSTKRFFRLLFYSILIILLFFQIEKNILKMQSEYNYKLVILYWFIFPFIFGLLLSLPTFLYIVKKDGTWGFDWIRFFALGLPAFYLSTYYLWYFLAPTLARYIYPQELAIANPRILITISTIVLGYLVFSSFKKS